jgi:hypothetical protein
MRCDLRGPVAMGSSMMARHRLRIESAARNTSRSSRVSAAAPPADAKQNAAG